jgi:hypothetical protein
MRSCLRGAGLFLCALRAAAILVETFLSAHWSPALGICMDSIIRQLQDPGWWFTAVFVGTLISVASPFLYDGLSAIASRFSAAVKERRRLRLERRARFVALLVAHPNLLLMQMAWVIFGTIAFFGTLSLTMVIGLHVGMETANPESGAVLFLRRFLTTIFAVNWLTSMWIGYNLAVLIIAPVEAWRKYMDVLSERSPAPTAHPLPPAV